VTSIPSIIDAIGRTPLVRLQRVGAGLPVPIYVKCEHLNPGGSVKDRIARAIVEDAEARGLLSPGATLIEATAGNTGMGLALIAASRGYRLVCVMPEKMSQDKRDALAMLGAQVIITKNAPPSSPENFQAVARRLAEERGWFLTDQFENPVNPAVHERTTAKEIDEQAGGDIGAFVAGVGTGGTITGVGRYFKRKDPSIRIVLADPAGSGLAGWVERRELGPDAAYQVEGIGSSKVPATFDASVVDAAETIPDAESFEMTRRLLVEEGLFVGGSAGTAVAAALRVAARGDVRRPVVALLPDGWDRYRSKPWMVALMDAGKP
jgi:cysteine synthase